MSNFFEHFLGKRERSTVSKEQIEPILPYPVRDHLRESSMLPKELVQSLVRNGSEERAGFENVALYLTMKASGSDPELEKAFLHELAGLLASHTEESKAQRTSLVRGFVESAIKRIPGEWSVDARNMARISRHGFRLTDERYEAHAKRLATDSRNVFIIGHATFVGLASFIDSFRNAGKSLYVLIPSFISEEDPHVPPDERNHPAGYVIEPDGTVRLLGHSDLAAANGIVLVDDVRRTGKTEQQLRSYFDALGITNIDTEPLQDASA